MSFISIQFKEFITLQRGFDLPAQSRVNGAFPILGATSVTGYHSDYKVDPPTVITGRSGALGEVQWVNYPCWPLNTTLWVKDFKGNNPRYVYYYLKTIDLNRFNSGAGVPTLNRNDLDTLPILAHSKRQQCSVAAILSVYDDLIQNNTRRIAILEEMARRVYEEWFVRFRFPGHEDVRMVESDLGLVPEGWSVVGLYDVAELTYGYPFKSTLFNQYGEGLGVIRIRDIRNDCTETFTDELAGQKYKVVDGDILIGMDGAFHMGRWAGGMAWLNQRVVRLQPKRDVPRSWLFLVTEQPIKTLEATIVGTTVAHLSARDLKEMRLIFPSREVLIATAEILEPIFALELALKKKNANLRTTRDLLLPKLISGEIDVSAIPAPESIAA